MPTPKCPRGISLVLDDKNSSKSSNGNCVKRPDPSPVFLSLPVAPLWVRLITAWMAFCRTLFVLVPSISATKPTPQESCSNSFSYNNLFFFIISYKFQVESII